jgi:hypothetical protein
MLYIRVESRVVSLSLLLEIGVENVVYIRAYIRAESRVVSLSLLMEIGVENVVYSCIISLIILCSFSISSVENWSIKCCRMMYIRAYIRAESHAESLSLLLKNGIVNDVYIYTSVYSCSFSISSVEKWLQIYSIRAYTIAGHTRILSYMLFCIIENCRNAPKSTQDSAGIYSILLQFSTDEIEKLRKFLRVYTVFYSNFQQTR